ncbi:MAG: GIY-YIG nuclease family protein [Clostridia bacterium]
MSPETADAWYLYMLRCRGGSIYTGITNDLHARWCAHREGSGARYTRSFPPEDMLAAWHFARKGAAARAEMLVKGLPAEDKRRLVAGSLPDGADIIEGGRRIDTGDLPLV